MSLFDVEIVRTPDPSPFGERTFDCINRNSRPVFQRIRDELDRWFSRYPEERKAEFRKAIRSRFNSAFFELFIHELLVASGYSVEIEPPAPAGRSRPDSLARKLDNQSLYVEATVSTDQSDSDRARENVVEEIRSRLTQEFSKGPVYLNVLECSIPAGEQPAVGEIIRFVASRVGEIDAGRVPMPRDPERLPLWTYQRGGIRIVFEAFAKSNAARERSTTAFGIVSMESQWGGCEESLKRSINAKAKQHGSLDRPYVIAVNAASPWGTEDYEVSKVLYGSESIDEPYTYQPTGEGRQENPVFRGPRGSRNEQVSAVLVARYSLGGLLPWNIGLARVELYSHPRPRCPLHEKAIDVPSVIVKDGKLMWQRGRPAHRILGLPDGWPPDEMNPLSRGS